MRMLLLCGVWLTSGNMYGQSTYIDSLEKFIAGYRADHGVVKGTDRQYLSFFPIDIRARVIARFEPIKSTEWFDMPTSSGRSKMYRVYGRLHFTHKDSSLVLYVYQSQALLQDPAHAFHLFLPFTDLTSSSTTYESGRYIDLATSDIQNNAIVIDFNKAYNPYCAYISGVYSCPVPPKENRLKVAIEAGEKKYLKH